MQGNFEPGRFVRDTLKELIPYNPGDYQDLIKLDANENPFDFPSQLMQEINNLIGPQTFNRYPDAMSKELIKELANWHKVDNNQIIAGNGSDELILDLMLAFGAQNRVVIAVPTFSMYGIHARIAGAEIVEVKRKEAFELDVPRIIEAAEGAGLVVICSPNNPSGNSDGREHIIDILENCSCPVIVDQAYVEFGGTDFMDLLKTNPNLVLLRTFSKAYALAGLRVGYLITHPEIALYLLKVKQPFNLNVFSQAAALTVLRNREIFLMQVKQIKEEVHKIYRTMSEMPKIKVYPSDTNYLLFETTYSAKEVFRGLLEQKILVRNFGDPDLAGFLRISAGKPEENEIFLSAMQQVIDTLREKKNERE